MNFIHKNYLAFCVNHPNMPLDIVLSGGGPQSPPFLLPEAGIGMASNKTIDDALQTLVAKVILTLGYELVLMQMIIMGRESTLQIMAERLDGKPMLVDDCALISRSLSEKLEDDVTLVGDYTLEVSSPGIDRPLVRLKDYERWAGHLAKIELDTPLDGRRRFQGNITEVGKTGDIAFRTETGEVRVPMERIAKAKLVLTDALLSAAAGTKH